MMTLVLAFMGAARAEVVTIGTGTGTTYVTPFNSLWGYSFVEQIYTASEIGTAGTINSISFNMSTSDSQTNQIEVFMKNVSRSTFSSSTDYEPVTASDMVFSGTVTFNNGWTTITLDTPFEYDGTSNLLVGMHEFTSGYSTRYFYYTTATDMVLSYHSDGANPNPYNLGSYSGNKYTSPNRANIQLDITAGGGAGFTDQLHVQYMDGENVVIDSLNLGVRPINAWTEPFEFTMYSEGPNYTVTVLDFTPSDGMFTAAGEELPFQVSRTADVDLTIATNATTAGLIERQFVAITEGDRAAHVWPIVVEMYDPQVPDVWEKACTHAIPLVEVPARAHNTELHNDYDLPFDEIEEGYDAVYKLVFANDMVLNAEVSNGENGKVALYTEDFYGEGGPMATNNYQGPMVAGGSAAGPFEAQIGEGTSTLGYLPMYAFYNYSISEQLFTATELIEAGVTTAPFTSLSWYATSIVSATQNGISIWMANVDDAAMTTTSHLTSGMTLVYTGSLTPAVGWNEFVLNGSSFSWDGTSNLLICVQRNNGSYQSGMNWQVGNVGFTASDYRYNDGSAYDMTTTQYTTYTSTSRANIIMKGGSREDGNRNLVTIGEGTATTNVYPTQATYNYCFNEMIYPAASIGTAGTINSIGWHYNGASELNRSVVVYMKNTSKSTFASMTDWEPVTASDMVYTGTLTSAAVDQWVTLTLNTPFYYDGTSNLLIAIDDNTGSWSTRNWYYTTGAENCCMTCYNDNNNPDPYNPGSASGRHSTLPNMQLDITPGGAPVNTEISYGPVITNAPVAAGTYYLVASSTSRDFEVTINAQAMPCPTVDGFAFGEMPSDNEDGIEPASVELKWNMPANATSYQVFFGSTYYPQANHPQTVISDVTPVTGPTGSFTVSNLWNNTNYFWYVVFYNNGACTDGVESPHWGFTTHLNIPQNLVANDETIFNDETVTLSWNAVVDRTFRTYWIYRDGVKIDQTTVNNIGAVTYTDGPLPYNMNGYTYYVTAIYDEGESAPSNTVNVKVSGYGDVNGHVFEQDGETGIAGATVTMVGTDEFGDAHTYTFITDGNGYYSGHIYAGEYNGQAACNGYQTIDAPEQGNPIAINYNETTSPIDYFLDENFDGPCTVIAEYYPDSLDPQSPYVKVYWGCGLPGEEIVEPFETGDFSGFDWQLDPTYPWSVVTTAPYEGEYCMKSGGAGVANVVSNMTVTVEIPNDGIMSFFGKISCEQNWDFGYFYIDGQQMGSYTGTSGWGEKKFDITAGTHTFQWRYTKDGSVNSNDDCFYVDYISFYKRPEPAQPGWHTYAEGEFNNAVGSNVGTSRWAYEYPASMMAQYAGFTMTKVSLFSDNMYSAVGGNYTCTIYAGGNEPMAGTAVSSITVDVPQNVNDWVDFDLTTPVAVSGTETLWVVWTANTHLSNWPAGCCDGLVDQGTWWSAGLEAGYGWEHTTYGTWTMRQYFTNRAGRGFFSYANDAAKVEAPAVAYAPAIAPVKGQEVVTATCVNPNAVPGARIESNTRYLHHYNIYRTNCYNDGPYTAENTVLLSTSWPYDTVYIDVEWADLPAGVYKWGVGAVYVGNRGELTESEISWSEPANVNGADMATRDEFSYGFESDLEGWTVIDVNAAGGTWLHSSNNPGGYDYTTHAHSGTGYALCYSFVDYDGAYDTDSYLVSPQKYSIVNGSNITFWADNANDSYPENFSVCVATADNPTAADFTAVWNGSAKGNGGAKAEVRRDPNRYDNWRSHNVDLSAYAGQEVWIAFHDVNYDAYEVWIDDVTINAAAGGNTPGGNSGLNQLAEPRESETIWSNCLDKDMYLEADDVTINVLLNSADSPEGVNVTFTNYNEGEQELYGGYELVLDETGYYAFESFRKGEYNIKIEFEGYEPITDSVSIWEATDLRYVMTEIIYAVNNLYVSSTGWAMWDPQGAAPGPQPGPTPGPGTEFSFGFEEDPAANGWTIQSHDATTWVREQTTQFGAVPHEGQWQMWLHWSYGDQDEWLITPEFTVPANGNLEFWHYGQEGSTNGDHYYVKISTDGGNTWTELWDASAQPNMENHYTSAVNVNLSAYAGQNAKLAWQGYAAGGLWYAWCVDDITVSGGREVISFDGRQWLRKAVVATEPDGTLSFSKAGDRDGDRHLEYFKVMCESLDHEPIFNADVPADRPFCQVNTDELVAGEHYFCKVAAVYSTGMSAWAECEWQYIPCDNYAGTVDGVTIEGNTISWTYPGAPGPGPQPGEGSTFSENCDNGMPAGWTNVDADGDGYIWVSSMNPGNYHNAGVDLTGNGHNGSAHFVLSGSWANGTGQVLYPDNYLVSPQVTLTNGSTFSFWACAQDASYAADHFGVFISDNGTSDWTMVNEWTMTAKNGGNVMSAGRGGEVRAQGNWYNYSVDLSAFAGQKYIAIRHFNCSDQFIINVDDIELTVGAKSNREGQWYYYDNGNNMDAIGLSSGTANFSWGIMFPAGSYNSGNLTKVGYYDYTAHTGNIHIYQGGTGNSAPGAELYTQPYTVNGTETYIEIALAAPVAVDATQALWVVMESTTPGYTAAIDDSGVTNPNGGLVSTDGVSFSPIDVASSGGITGNWNLRAYIEDGAPVPPVPAEGNVLGAMIFADGEWEAFVEYPTNSYVYEGDAEEVCVRMVYDGTNTLPEGNIFYSMSCPECEPWNSEPACEPGEAIHSELVDSNHVKVWWGVQPPEPMSEWLYYDNGEYSGSVGTGGSDVYWGIMLPSASLSTYAGTSLTKVAVFTALDANYNAQPITVRIFLGGTTAPQTLVSEQTFTPSVDLDFEEVTLNTVVPIDGTQNLWITCKEYGAYPCNGTTSAGDPNARWISTNGTTWSDVFSLNPDLNYDWMIRGYVTNQAKGGMVEAIAIEDNDVAANPAPESALGHIAAVENISAPMAFLNRANRLSYNVYRSTSADGEYALIGNVAETGADYYEYIDSPTEAGTYYYQVTAVYDNDCESEPAPAYDDPSVNYVSATTTTTGMDENAAEVALFPNPTKGNVTIQAAGMNHITVVSVLGQVVYDADVDADEMTLNMAQFNAGLYTVRISTSEGVAVRRLTVVR